MRLVTTPFFTPPRARVVPEDMAIAHTTTADPNPDSRMPRASLPVSILLPAVARQQPLAVPLPQHAAATSALVYLPGEQAVPITSNFTRGMQSVAGPASRESASQDQQGAERSSPFCVGMLLNRFKVQRCFLFVMTAPSAPVARI